MFAVDQDELYGLSVSSIGPGTEAQTSRGRKGRELTSHPELATTLAVALDLSIMKVPYFVSPASKPLRRTCRAFAGPGVDMLREKGKCSKDVTERSILSGEAEMLG